MSLFWRIFFSFWLAMALLVGVMAYTTFRVADQWNALNAQNQLSFDAVAERADAVLKAGGEARLRTWLRNPSNFPPGQTLFVVDPSGQEILERPLPPPVQATVDAPQEVQPDRFRARPLVALDGTQYVAVSGFINPSVIGFTDPSVLGVLATPQMRWTLLIAAFVMSPLVCFALSRSLTKPLRRVVDATRRLAAGDLSARVGASARLDDEVSQLGQQFDDMAEHLERLIGARTELFRNVSHELRTPLARIQIAAELARRKPEELEEQLSRIERETQYLEQLTRQALSLAHLVESPDDTELQEIDLVEVVDGVAQDAAFEADAQGKEVLWEGRGTRSIVRANPDLLHAAIENVVRNAVRHTPPGTKVEVRLEPNGNAVELSVRDDGPGVPTKDLKKIFEPFQHGPRTDGTGVGLAITQRVVAHLNGSVRAQNNPEGGLIVKMLLPLARASTL